jgi:hypothetical protein
MFNEFYYLMNSIQINRFRLSYIIWDCVLSKASSLSTYEEQILLINESLALEKIRRQANYNTGSISFPSFWLIYSLS